MQVASRIVAFTARELCQLITATTREEFAWASVLIRRGLHSMDTERIKLTDWSLVGEGYGDNNALWLWLYGGRPTVVWSDHTESSEWLGEKNSAHSNCCRWVASRITLTFVDLSVFLKLFWKRVPNVLNALVNNTRRLLVARSTFFNGILFKRRGVFVCRSCLGNVPCHEHAFVETLHSFAFC